MRLGISTQQRIIEGIARRVRARMGVHVNQSRKQPAAIHHCLGARDCLVRNPITVDPEVEHLLAGEDHAAKVDR